MTLIQLDEKLQSHHLDTNFPISPLPHPLSPVRTKGRCLLSFCVLPRFSQWDYLFYYHAATSLSPKLSWIMAQSSIKENL